jgi:tRNA-splicing ligase RtcB (3'-phosphate/5'-hydroxy nucleic acid ligase)
MNDKIKSWCNNIEDGAMKQIENLTNLPFIFKHVAIMPDCHQGYGMPIGGVMATKGVVVPYAVGVDIGCGMCAVKTSLTEIDKETLKKIMGEIRKVIPVGFAHHQKEQDESLMPNFGNTAKGDETYDYPIVWAEYNSALKQLGTLGGGNHFIDILKGSDGHVWIMLHSGSRNLGKKVADYHNDVAVKLNDKWHSKVPKEWQLAFLPVDSEEGQTYLREMQYCVDFALANRKLMMERIMQSFRDCFGMKEPYDPIFEPIINIAHNYARMENHFGKNVMVHRKGATLAAEGTIGIVPGSMGTNSYIVKGKGNKDSYNSCSHGAGRVLGRKQAIRTLNLEQEIKSMDDKGIIHGIRTQDELQEAPSSYKDIKTVMEQQKDLVDILVELFPIGVIVA